MTGSITLIPRDNRASEINVKKIVLNYEYLN